MNSFSVHDKKVCGRFMIKSYFVVDYLDLIVTFRNQMRVKSDLDYLDCTFTLPLCTLLKKSFFVNFFPEKYKIF